MRFKKKGYADERKYKTAVKRQKQRYRAKTAFKYERRYWLPEEDALVLAHNIPDPELSEMISRSVQAIHIRRSRLKSTVAG